MDNEKIIELSASWSATTDKVLNLETLDRKSLSNLFWKTYLIIKKYCRENLIPKELYRVLWEMNDFHWWVIETKETPMHIYHHEITSLVIGFNSFLLSGQIDELEVRYNLERIESEL